VKEDEARIDNGRHELLLYVEKSDGSYGSIQTGAYMATNYMDDFVQKRKNLENECMEKLRAGEISAVGYYMLLRDMTVADVAARVGISKSNVRKHMAPEGLKKVRLEIIGKYAEVFGVPLQSMLQVIVPKDGTISVTFGKTNNPYMSIMEIGRGAP
jgi:DNA-binding Xre family transcriptional regulator